MSPFPGKEMSDDPTLVPGFAKRVPLLWIFMCILEDCQLWHYDSTETIMSRFVGLVINRGIMVFSFQEHNLTWQTFSVSGCRKVVEAYK